MYVAWGHISSKKQLWKLRFLFEGPDPETDIVNDKDFGINKGRRESSVNSHA